MITYKKEFKKFLLKNLNLETVAFLGNTSVLESWYKDFEDNYRDGGNSFELSSEYTKTGNPVTFDFNR